MSVPEIGGMPAKPQGGNMRLILAAVRLFADSGTDQQAPPIYRVIIGAPLRPRVGRP
jgi:hypothetical protein